MPRLLLTLSVLGCLTMLSPAVADEDIPAAPELVEGKGEGWVTLGEKDFANVNTAEDTWTWKDGLLHCTGRPVGVMKTTKKYKNFEMVVEWKHLKPAGNSGVFLWAIDESLAKLKPGGLPHGIEVQILDHGYKTRYEKNGRKADWFTTNGDVFSVGAAKMEPFPPVSPNGRRSFPKQETTKGHGEWNHYYIKAVDGEVRLTVNGVEVSGGKNCKPAMGVLCLESEGSPIEFRNIRIRELP